MSDERITAEEVSQWLKSQKRKAVWLAEALQVTPATVSRWLNGKNPISGSDEALLKLLIRGEMPFDLISQPVLGSVLEFTPDQWRVIGILARKDGLSEGTWITNQIRSFLAFDPIARAVAAQDCPEHLSMVADSEDADAPTSKGPVTYRTGSDPK